MSGRDLVQEMRESGKAPRAPSSGGGAFEWVMGVVIVVAVGLIGYYGMTQWLSPKGPQPGSQPPVATIVAQSAPLNSAAVAAAAWTDADTKRCLSNARVATAAPLPPELAFANRAVTEGFGGLATRLTCHLTSKVRRFCDPKEKEAIVAMVNDYLNRSDLVQLGLGVQGAPMALLGGTFGGEIAAGSSVYDEQKSQTLKFMASYDKKVAVALQALARDGLVVPADFSSFMGGVPKNVEALFGNSTAQRNLCA